MLHPKTQARATQTKTNCEHSTHERTRTHLHTMHSLKPCSDVSVRVWNFPLERDIGCLRRTNHALQNDKRQKPPSMNTFRYKGAVLRTSKGHKEPDNNAQPFREPETEVYLLMISERAAVSWVLTAGTAFVCDVTRRAKAPQVLIDFMTGICCCRVVVL